MTSTMEWPKAFYNSYEGISNQMGTIYKLYNRKHLRWFLRPEVIKIIPKQKERQILTEPQLDLESDLWFSNNAQSLCLHCKASKWEIWQCMTIWGTDSFSRFSGRFLRNKKNTFTHLFGRQKLADFCFCSTQIPEPQTALPHHDFWFTFYRIYNIWICFKT